MNNLRTRFVSICLLSTIGSLPCTFAQAPGPYFPSPLLRLEAQIPGGVVASQDGLLADVNGDGAADVVTRGSFNTSGAGTYFFVSLANGGGFANPGIAWATVPTLFALAPADVDADGDIDILAISGSLAAPALWIHLNNGLGDFSNVVQQPAPPSGFVTPFVGNFDADGLPDLMLRGTNGQYVTLINTGGGNFGTANPTIQGLIADVTFLDDDQDGDDDAHYLGAAGVLVRRNNGNGTFAAEQVLMPSPFIGGSAVYYGDVDADGDTDGILVSPTGPLSSTQIQVLRRDAAGVLTAEPAQTVSDRNFLRAIPPMDLDGDGAVEIIPFHSNSGTGTFLHLANDGTGNFSLRATVDYAGLGNFFRPAVGDYNTDGVPDIVSWVSQGVILHEGLGNQTFRVPEPIPAQGVASDAPMRSADLNNDGQRDAIYSSSLGVTGIINAVLSVGLSRSQAATNVPAAIQDFDLGDFNGDGILDLVSVATTNFSSVEILLGDGTGRFTSSLSLPTNGPAIQALARDMDGDGRLDLVVRDNEISVFLGLGNGQFNPAIPTIVCTLGCNPIFNAGATRAGIGDLNGDGSLDLVLTVLNFPGLPSSVVTLLGNGGGSFSAPLVATSAAIADRAEVVDINNDGIDDIIGGGNGLSVILGSATGSLGVFTSFSFPSISGLVLNSPVSAGDVNGDGNLDVINAAGALWIGDGLGGFTPDLRYVYGLGTKALIDDFDSDLQADILTLLPGDRGLVLSRNRIPCTGIGVPYGLGCPGSNGIRPTLSARGCAQPGGQLSLDLRGALGGSPAWLIVGTTPAITTFASGCFSHVDLSTATLAPITLQGQARPGGGTLSLTTSLAANVPPGLSYALQVIVSDTGSPTGFSGSNGVFLFIQ